MKKLFVASCLLLLVVPEVRAQTEAGHTVSPGLASLRVLAPTENEPRAWSPSSELRPQWTLASDAEELSALMAVAPQPVSRETLDGEAESLQRYHSLPGGIVLGLRAEVPAELRQARLARDEAGALGLRLDASHGGGFVRAPALDPEQLRVLARFVQGRFDGLVDLTGLDVLSPRVAPAFEGTALGELLVRMDKVPHREVPALRVWKTLIVDRATRVQLQGEALLFTADLEVRCYDDGAGTGWARRTLVVEAAGDRFVGPRTSDDLGGELAPLAEIAGWLGFLRWAEAADPRGFAALCDGAPFDRAPFDGAQFVPTRFVPTAAR